MRADIKFVIAGEEKLGVVTDPDGLLGGVLVPLESIGGLLVPLATKQLASDRDKPVLALLFGAVGA